MRRRNGRSASGIAIGMTDPFVFLKEALSDRYEVQREIGRGGMARVFLAEEEHPARKVAIKVLDPDIGTLLARQRFLREVKLSSQLTHPHIVPIFSAGEVGDLLYYVMPYIAGESLRNRLAREGRIPAEEALEIAREVAGALGYAHSHEVIHRDIKPENILLSGGHAVVADFGIARALSAAGEATLTQVGFAIGTPTYMSPEQAVASGKVDSRSDIYSLGCVLYEMLVGEPPFTASTAQEIMIRHSLDPVPSLSKVRGAIPEITKRAIMKSLSKRPSDRFATAEEFARELTRSSQAFIAGAPLRRARSRIAVAITLAAVMIGTVGGVVLMSRANDGADLAPNRVVIAGFENQTGDASLDVLGSMAVNWIAQDLASTALVEVVPGSRTPLLSAQATAGGSSAIRSLAEATGAGKIITGTYYLNADAILFQTSITDVIDDRLTPVDPVQGPANMPREVVESLRQAVVGALAQIVDDRLRKWAEASSRPPSFEAYREYVEGMAKFTRLDTPNAIEHLLRAAAYDESFTGPLVFAAFAFATIGQWQQADSLVHVVSASRDQLAPFDRYVLDWVTSFIDGDTRGLLDPIRRAEALAPGSEALILVGMTNSLLNRPRAALDAFEALDQEHGLTHEFFLLWTYITRAYAALGEGRAALRAARRGKDLYPNLLATLDNEMFALARLGRAQAVLQLAPECRNLDPHSTWTPGSVFLNTALHLRASGESEVASQLVDEAIAWYRGQAEQPGAAPTWKFGLGRAFYIGERWDEARVLFEQLAAEAPDSVSYAGYIGAIAARRGAREEADRVTQNLRRMTQPYLFGEHLYWQARIAAILGETERATDLMSRARDEGFGISRLGWWFWVDLESDEDLSLVAHSPSFRELLRPQD